MSFLHSFFFLTNNKGGGKNMKKTNELNKLLSYIHMGNSIFRVYGKEALRLNDEKLIKVINDISDLFKSHEEMIIKFIEKENEHATSSISLTGKIGIYKEKIKTYKDSYSICISAIKSVNMGLISTLKFLDENKNLKNTLKRQIIKIIDDYCIIIEKLKEYAINLCS